VIWSSTNTAATITGAGLVTGRGHGQHDDFGGVCYKLQGERIVLTLHNVNAGRRDSTDLLSIGFTLRFQYRLADQILCWCAARAVQAQPVTHPFRSAQRVPLATP
jgi:hypothetical protein